MSFVPNSQFRVELNFFQDFFWTAEDFTDWLKEDLLDKETTISDTFITAFYYAFLREYRNQIVVEQEDFIQDLTMAFVNHKRQFEILYSIWMTANDSDPFQMIRNNRYDQRDYHRNDQAEEERKNQNISDVNKTDLQNSNDSTKMQSENQSSGSDNTQTKSKTLERDLENQGKIQGKLALNDLIVNDENLDTTEHYATNASINKNERDDNTLNLTGNSSKNNTTNDNVNITKNKSDSKQIDNQIGKNKSNSQTNSHDFNKSFDQNKVDLIKKFTNSDLTEGFQKFVRAEDFRLLFGRMNAGLYEWYGYEETQWDDIPLVEVPDNKISLTEILVNTKIGFIDRIDAPTITKQIIYVNPGITTNDFFVSNIYPDKLNAYVVGKGKYSGFLEITYVTKSSIGGNNV